MPDEKPWEDTTLEPEERATAILDEYEVSILVSAKIEAAIVEAIQAAVDDEEEKSGAQITELERQIADLKERISAVLASTSEQWIHDTLNDPTEEDES